MKILGISGNKEEKALVAYVLSLFEGCSTEYLSSDDSDKIRDRISKPVLMVTTAEDLDKLDSTWIKEVPVFLLSTASVSEEFPPLFDNKIWDSYHLPDFETHFDVKEGLILDIQLRLRLIRKVNHILYYKLNLKLDSSSCGIERSAVECGDESDY